MGRRSRGIHTEKSSIRTCMVSNSNDLNKLSMIQFHGITCIDYGSYCRKKFLDGKMIYSQQEKVH